MWAGNYIRSSQADPNKCHHSGRVAQKPTEQHIHSDLFHNLFQKTPPRKYIDKIMAHLVLKITPIDETKKNEVKLTL